MLLLVVLPACGAAPGKAVATRHLPAGPVPCVEIEREGDPASAIGASVTTAGIADAVRPAVALAALFRERLTAKWPGVTVTAGGDGLRVSGLVASADAPAIALGLRAALSGKVRPGELDAPKKALAALAHRPLAAPAAAGADARAAALEVGRCEGTPYALGAVPEPTLAELEAWRAAAVGEGRLAFSVVGTAAVLAIASDALVGGARWPKAASYEAPAATATSGVGLVEAVPSVPPGTARVYIAFRDPSVSGAVAAASDLADARGPLATRLATLGSPRAPVDLEQVTATAHPFGGCLLVSIDVANARFGDDVDAAAGRVAEAVALARQEVGLRLAAPPVLEEPARRAGDPREAAALASWWALARNDLPEKHGVSVLVETSAPPKPDGAQTSDALKAAIDRADKALGKPLAETRVKVERGQDEVWVLFGSPCGALAERASDAGLGAAFVVAAVAAASARGEPDVTLEPWISADGLGVVAHGGRRGDESPDALARRVADAAARSFAAQPIESSTLSLVRGSLLGRAQAADARAEAALALGLYPEHPSWLDARGTAEALARSSDGAILARGDDLRSGPLRVAVLANDGAAQGTVAAKAADRWIARRSAGVRTCDATSAAEGAHFGTYAVEARARPPEARLAFRLPHDDAASRALAAWWAALLGGDDGLLASAVGGPGLARGWSARVLGPDRDGALAVTVVSSDAALDSAVAQTRALFDRLRQGALTQADLTKAIARRSHDDTVSALDPRARLVALWRGSPTAGPPPSLDALKTFAAATFKDDALVIVAARPPRIEEPQHEKSP